MVIMKFIRIVENVRSAIKELHNADLVFGGVARLRNGVTVCYLILNKAPTGRF